MKSYLHTFLLCSAFLCLSPAVKALNSVSGSRPNPLRFTENKGQWDNRILYHAQLPNGTLLLEGNAFYYFFYSAKDLAKIQHPGTNENVLIHGHAFREEFIGAKPHPVLQGVNSYSDYANFYIGNNASHWASEVKIYRQVTYSDLYQGVDLSIYSKEEQQLKYDFIVHPNGNTDDIGIRYRGADQIKLKKKGLQIETSVTTLTEEHPIAYQLIEGKRVEVACQFLVIGNDVKFIFPQGYNHLFDLVIDPTIVFSTYTGSTADNWGYTATYDNHENMYVGGYVNAFAPAGSAYPTTVGAFQAVFGGGTGGNNGTGNGIAFACDMGISKFSADGTQLLYSTYIGGSDNETPHSLVVDPQDNLIIYGVSFSVDYPISSTAFSKTQNGQEDIVVTKLNAAGTALLGSTFVGGSSDDGINFDAQEFTSGNLKRNYGDQNRGEVNIDAAGNIYVASCTKSSDFPVTNGAFQSTFGGNQDGCAFKLSSDCSQLLWCTYLGGSADDACYSLDIGPNGTLYVAGGTMSSNFPTTNGSLHSTYQGGLYDGFLAHINASGTQLLASSFIGTSGNDQVYFVKLDASGNVYVVGQTTGQYPVVNAPYSNPNSGQFIVKANPALSSVFYSTVFGNGSGQPNISPTAFLVDTCENVYVAGWGTNNPTFSGFQNGMLNMPLSPDAAQTSTDGTDFYFFVLSKNVQNLLYASYFGGNGAIEHVDGGTSRFDKRGVIYEAICAGCGGTSLTPTTPGVWAPNNLSSNCNLLGLKIAFNLSGTHVAINAYPKATGCVPLTVNFQGTINNAQSFSWDFGDGSSSTQQNPIHTFTDTGTYTIMLIGVDSNSCNLADTAYVEVWVRNDSLSADFLPNLLVDCDSNLVSVSSNNYATAQYHWDMGDGTNFTTHSVQHQYQSPGTHTITLIVSDTSKCNLLDTFAATIFIPSTLHANFTSSDTSGCKPLQVQFAAPTNGNAHYNWIFGDGNSSTTNPVNHTYNNAGTYTVSLIVSDTSSCNKADTAYALITVIDSFADASFHFNRTFYGCDSVRVDVWSTYAGEDSELWDFGDGTSASSDSASHTYTIGGSYTIVHYLTDADKICKPLDTAQIAVSLFPLSTTFTVPDTGGCLPFTAQFTGNSTLLSTDYYWFFGDGDSTSGESASHIYNSTGTFDVLLIGVDTNACVGADSVFAQITVINDSVIADFQLQVLNDCDSNLVIDLTNQSTNAIEHFWNFGDGATSTQLNEQHTYTQPSTYTITLVVTDTNRCHPIDSISKTVQLLPNVSLDFTLQNVCFGNEVVFTNLSHPNAQFSWSFGDGATSSQYSPTHSYGTPDIFQVRLIIVDSSTCDVVDTLIKSVQVFEQPLAGFIVPKDTFKFETPVTFNNKSLYYTNLWWNFGDGTTATGEESPVHTYETIGWMHVCIVASNDACSDTSCRDIFISYNALIGVPNAFSPNGDGVNDRVKVEGKGIVELTFRIFNRWGEKVFETHDKNIGWDGYYKGVLQEMEVYTYAVEAKLINGETVPLKGNITLLR